MILRGFRYAWVGVGFFISFRLILVVGLGGRVPGTVPPMVGIGPPARRGGGALIVVGDRPAQGACRPLPWIPHLPLPCLVY